MTATVVTAKDRPPQCRKCRQRITLVNGWQVPWHLIRERTPCPAVGTAWTDRLAAGGQE